MEEVLKILYEQTQVLEREIRFIDSQAEQAKSGRVLLNENLVWKFVNLKVKMYQEHHNRPHVHIDIGRENHSASIAIEDQELLAGSIEKKYEKVVLEWIKTNKDKLLIIWNRMQEGQAFDLSSLK